MSPIEDYGETVGSQQLLQKNFSVTSLSSQGTPNIATTGYTIHSKLPGKVETKGYATQKEIIAKEIEENLNEKQEENPNLNLNEDVDINKEKNENPPVADILPIKYMQPS